MSNDKKLQPDNYDEYPCMAFGPTVLEQVLLAIIKAHPPKTGNASNSARIKKAMEALLGKKHVKTPFENDVFDKALRFVAQQRHADEANVNLHKFRTRKEAEPLPAPQIRSYAELAREAANKFMPSKKSQEIHSNAKRLEEMISGRHQTKGNKHTNIDFKRTYQFRAVQYDYVGETLEAQAVQRICDELAKWGTPAER